jgi:mRNA interferase MazF
MRPIHIAQLDKARPVLLLTREVARPHLRRVTVAPITSTIRGLSSELLLGPRNGLDHECVASLDNVTTVPVSSLGAVVGFLVEDDERRLTETVARAFDLDL